MDQELESNYELQTDIGDDNESHGWPGDGSGEDDLADHNANEADDYRDEGIDDCHDRFDGE